MKHATKSLNLPKPIAAYFSADKGDARAVPQCFTENAIVTDEGHTYKGRAAIGKWKTDTSAKYEYTSEPFACEDKDGKTVVVGRSETPGVTQFAVARFNLDGSLDTSFGGGVVRSPLGNLNTAFANAVAIAPDQKIVVVGNARVDDVVAAVERRVAAR